MLDVSSKLISIIVNKRLQKLLKLRGITHQFGATPGTGCQNGLFCLKTLLQTRREHDLDTYCVFIDLVKAYDSIQHEIIDLAMRKMGAPTNLCKVVKKLYSDFNVVLKIGKVERKIPMGCGVRQGDNLAPTLFIMVMQMVSQVVQDECDKQGIHSPFFTTVPTQAVPLGYTLRKLTTLPQIAYNNSC